MNMLAAQIAPAARSITNYLTRRRTSAKGGGWDIDREVVRGRRLDFGRKFLPDTLSRLHTLPFLTGPEHLFLSHVQGRTYASFFGLAERFISCRMVEASADPATPVGALSAVVARIVDEERKHQALFARLESMIGKCMPAGYTFAASAADVACAVLGRSEWALQAVTLDIEVMTEAHYRAAMAPDATLDKLWKDVFLFHALDEAEHIVVDEALWRRTDAALTPAEREDAVTDFIDLVHAMDAALNAQAALDAEYFLAHTQRTISAGHARSIHDTLRRAYRWQHIAIGVLQPRFVDVVKALLAPAQMARIEAALAPILTATVAARQPSLQRAVNSA